MDGGGVCVCAEGEQGSKAVRLDLSVAHLQVLLRDHEGEEDSIGGACELGAEEDLVEVVRLNDGVRGGHIHQHEDGGGEQDARDEGQDLCTERRSEDKHE